MKVLKDQITALGLESQTDFFASGDQVLEKAAKLIKESVDGDPQPIKLMLLDNQMPRKSGQQVVTELRSLIAHQNQNRKVPIKEPTFVIVSTFLTSAFKKHLLAHDIKFTYDKPLHIDDLQAIVDQALS